MTKVIYKYELNPFGVTELQIYNHATILKLGFQDNTPFLWAIVDIEHSIKTVDFLMLGTGEAIPENAIYIDTALQGEYVWHLFKIIEP